MLYKIKLFRDKTYMCDFFCRKNDFFCRKKKSNIFTEGTMLFNTEHQAPKISFLCSWFFRKSNPLRSNKNKQKMSAGIYELQIMLIKIYFWDEYIGVVRLPVAFVCLQLFYAEYVYIHFIHENSKSLNLFLTLCSKL